METGNLIPKCLYGLAVVWPLGKSFYITFWSRTIEILSSLLCSRLLQDCTWIRSYGGVLLQYLWCLWLLFFFIWLYSFSGCLRSELWIRLNLIDSGSEPQNLGTPTNQMWGPVGVASCYIATAKILLFLSLNRWNKIDWNSFKIDKRIIMQFIYGSPWFTVISLRSSPTCIEMQSGLKPGQQLVLGGHAVHRFTHTTCIFDCVPGTSSRLTFFFSLCLTNLDSKTQSFTSRTEF